MHAIRMERWRQGLSGRERGQQVGMGEDQTGEEKMFTYGRGCANLHRGAPWRGGGTDRDRRKW